MSSFVAFRASLAYAIVSSALVACGGDDKTESTFGAPTCDALQKQYDACTNVSAESKANFGPFCTNASDDCRRCLDGTLCGTTEQCDALCKK